MAGRAKSKTHGANVREHGVARVAGAATPSGRVAAACDRLRRALARAPLAVAETAADTAADVLVKIADEVEGTP